MRVLVVDDEQPLREALERALRVEHYEVETAESGAQALERMKSGGHGIDAVVLDVLMPGIDGLEVCRHLRNSGDKTPVLMLTARVEVEDRVAGLDAGADDYVTKPFDLEELLARLRALLRRAGSPGNQTLRYADLALDPVAHEVRRGERLIAVTRTDPLEDNRAGLGLRLRAQLQLARGLHRLLATQDGERGRAASDPHDARRRLHPPRNLGRIAR
jgi:two-component system response regulator MprA